MTTVREITIDELAAARQYATPPLVLDVRNHAEYARGHVPGALNIPLDELPDRLAELRGAHHVAAICQSGRRSALAVKALSATGINAVSVGGGTRAWIEAGQPTNSVEGLSPESWLVGRRARRAWSGWSSSWMRRGR